MPIITEAQLRDQIRQPRQGMTIHLPPDARLSPSAQDFINQWKMEIVVGEAPGAAAPAGEETPRAGWDKPGVFPVVLTGELPRCTTCGMPVTPKPDHMTQLDAEHFSPKVHDRIRLRGKMDTLHGYFLLVIARARAENLPKLAEMLCTLAAYCREITSAEYHRRKVDALLLDGKTDDDLRKATHNPEASIGIAHIVPAPDDPEILHWLNLVRCQVREAEIVALDAISSHGGQPEDPDLAKAVNRLSNAVYYLELLYVAGKLK